MKYFFIILFFSSFLHAQTRGIKIDEAKGPAAAGESPLSFLNSYTDDNSNPTLLSNKDTTVFPKEGFFPSSRIFPKFYADGTAQQLSLNKDAFTREWIGGIGGIARIYQFNIEHLVIQIGIGATVYASLIKRPDVVDVQTVNFFVDLPIDIKLNEKFSFRTGYGHYSAHLADDGIEALNLHSINYAKDYIPLFAAYNLDNSGSCVYGGVRFDTYTIPEYNKRWNIQTGIQGGNYSITRGLKLYGAIDLKFKSEVSWESTQSYQVGIKVLEKDANTIRIAYTFRTGINDWGQFYKSRVKLSLIGVYIDL